MGDREEERGCRVAWTILRRSGRRDLSSNLSNPILIKRAKGRFVWKKRGKNIRNTKKHVL